MEIQSLLGSQPTTSADGKSVPAASAENEFLKLLVAQLKYQDPLNPTGGTEFVAQLAQLAGVEQGAETNQQLAALATEQSTASRTAMTGLVGRDITASADHVTIDPSAGAMPPLTVHLAGSAAKAELDVTDSAGNVVRRIDLGPQTGGDIDVDWAAHPPPLAAGTYQLEVQATNQSGDPVEAKVLLHAVVDSVRFDRGETVLGLGAASVSPADIVSVGS